MNSIISLSLSLILAFTPLAHSTPMNQEATTSKPVEAVTISAPSAVLMEASTGTILFEKDASVQLRPASITKIMTLLLIFESLESKKIGLDDMVTVSEYAASMGGSQVFLETSEQQTVDTLIKCIAVSSANDACVAMAEYISGSEQEFVNQMNQKATDLGMKNTHFLNSCGLDVDGHLSTAFDIALMSRELILKYPQIHNYSTIWMENITHTTSKGSNEFGLANTNKLIKQYEYATGLKTGSTSLAKYCVSATAKKDDIALIGVIMAAPDYKVRFEDAITLLNYGFSKCQLYTDSTAEKLSPVPVAKGTKEWSSLIYESPFTYLDTNGQNLDLVTKEIQLKTSYPAPIKKDAVAGKAIYKIGDTEIGFVPILFGETIPKASFKDYLLEVCFQYLI